MPPCGSIQSTLTLFFVQLLSQPHFHANRLLEPPVRESPQGRDRRVRQESQGRASYSRQRSALQRRQGVPERCLKVENVVTPNSPMKRTGREVRDLDEAAMRDCLRRVARRG
jgi:hypothetical protein